mmetsp:Transcript_7202/g.6306  ORF Transcript_7202/g.6306 Transcript_7202/m.6306 type:complete len:108 (+) Transcript_7202:1198-1521(+)
MVSLSENHLESQVFVDGDPEAKKPLRNMKSMMNQLKEEFQRPQINKELFPNPNVFISNYKQGILVVENSSATIYGNKFDKNIKANIALGGKNSGESSIIGNTIENSK